ncbi:RNA-binding protein [archaeon]|nr:MAG: RNA-binding protein [archaeon]RLG65144.1 MAG: RNA-binding protein [archaeon]HDM24318.1 RNA-binding protein [Candidatus Bathyarchaeota archaeon]
MSKRLDDKISLIVKTPRKLERVAAQHIAEICDVEVIARPLGCYGIVLVRNCKDKIDVADKILREIPEAEKVLIVYGSAKADPSAIAEKASEIVKDKMSPDETFAVRTTRRGTHDFTSMDVNVATGAAIQEVTNANVNLTNPDKIVWVEIFGDIAYIAVSPGRIEWKKKVPWKIPLQKFFGKISIVQMPYTGPLDAVYIMGNRIGRAVQTFEIKELVIAPIYAIPAIELGTFIRGILEGIDSRHNIQERAYGRKVKKVPVYVQDLYQLVRDRSNEPIIVTSTRGKPVTEVKEIICDLFREKTKRVNVLIGAREGIPTGVFRFADVILDLSPGVTISTDYASVAAITGIGYVIYDVLFSEEYKGN